MLYFSAFEPWIIALVLYAAFVAVVFVSARYERSLGLDPLYNEAKEKRKKDKKRVITYAEESADQEVPSIDEILRKEQEERIRKLFSDSENKN